VTGGAGFVGANLTAALAERDPAADLIVIDDFRSGSSANIVEAFERRGLSAFSGVVLPLSVEDFEFDTLLKSAPVSAVFHLAAITDTTVADEAAMIASNTTPMMGIMHACVEAAVPLVYASSAATYGTIPQTVKRQAFPLSAAGKPSNVYGFSKWLMECEHKRLTQAMGAPAQIVGLRYFNVFGPGESRKGRMASMVYQLGKTMLSGKPPRVFKDGSQSRDQVYIDDVVWCTMAGAGLGSKTSPVPGVYNVGSGLATSFNEIVVALRESLGFSRGELPTDYFEMPPAVRAFYQDYTCADISETMTGLGWKPKWRPEEAIAHYARLLKDGLCR
jgi:ADP-L-glycero-D-manno-heptose 6-epimerase